MPICSQREYAKHRKAKGLSGGSRKAVQDALADGRIVKTPEGKIDSAAADVMWKERTNPALVRRSALVDRQPIMTSTGLDASTGRDDTADIKTLPPIFDEREHVARLAALEAITGPQQVLRFAAVCLRLGCTPQQAFGAALWHSCAATMALPDIAADELDHLDYPSDAEWAAVLGPIDFDKADELFEKATAPEVIAQYGI